MSDEPNGSPSGYFRFPSIHDDRVVFVCEDDLWEVRAEGGRARRLTTGRGNVTHPMFSPDGSKIAYTGREEGTPEVFVMEADGGPGEQLTYLGARSAVVGWSRDGGEVLVRTNHERPFAAPPVLYSVPVDGGDPERIGWPAHGVDLEAEGEGRVIARHSDDLARWKRYRGGRAGALWVDADGDGDWDELFADETAGQVRPLWVDDRIYFISDHEGFGNVYSCRPDGSDRTRHTHHEGFYARFAESDGEAIVYTCGGELYRLDAGDEDSERIDVDWDGHQTRLDRTFVDAGEYLDGWALHPEGHSLAITTRGKLYDFGNWEGAVRQHGRPQGVRYRLARYLDDERIVCVSDEEGEESLEIHRTDGTGEVETIDTDGDLGRLETLEIGPDAEALLATNHRHQLLHVDIDSGDTEVVDRSDHWVIKGIDWSPDGRFVAYGFHHERETSCIRIADLETGECRDVTSGRYRDTQPVFDPEGRYLYFLSCREFNPVYDQISFKLSFPRAMKPCVVTLESDERSPFFEEPRPLKGAPGAGEPAGEDDADGPEGEEADESEDDADDDHVEIDFEGIASRVEAFPVREAEYSDLAATEERVLWNRHPVQGSRGQDWSDWSEQSGTYEYFSLDGGEPETFAAGVSAARLGPDDRTLALKAGERLRVVDAGGKPPAEKKTGDEPSRTSGWIDLDRVRVEVEPRSEWRQMLREAWRLMRAHFWQGERADIDWDGIWERYSPLLEAVATRSEFSDLVWTMQGELGTSHAYEMGGDYERPPQYRPGYLGADLSWQADVDWTVGERSGSGGYRVDRIVSGEGWRRRNSSPLERPGVEVEEGDVVVAVNGRPFPPDESLQERLVHRAGESVELSAVGPDGGEADRYTVELLPSELGARYHDWVESNRQRVHELSEGELGYLHIPDMGPNGFAEFHRNFLSERSRTGLIVDVRYNGGGHVSQLLLEKLARERIGYDVSRWGEPNPYPDGAIEGPMVGLTNEHAGSDGDIFSHGFKLMDLGPLLGTRTWGGVVGIRPQRRLVDGSMVTQPEFGTWFEDVGYNLENYGTEPDVEVRQSPDDWENEEDPQLEAAVERAMEMLDENPPETPDLRNYPDVAPPDGLPD